MTPKEIADYFVQCLRWTDDLGVESDEYILAQAYIALESRIQKLEAVAEAAKDMAKRHNWTPGMGQCICPQHNAFYESIAELEQP